jgi:hypothetical protein
VHIIEATIAAVESRSGPVSDLPTVSAVRANRRGGLRRSRFVVKRRRARRTWIT